MGRGVRRSHRVNAPDAEKNENGPQNISIDYMYLNDEDGIKDHPQMVMVDHNNGRVFAYTVPKKGLIGEAEWVPSRMSRDIDNMGHKDVIVQIKVDQERVIVAVQEYIRLNRTSPTIPTNSPVGESECNGRAEDATRRVKEKARILIAQMEDGIQEKIEKGSNIIPWIVRWAGELISKYTPGFDGKTPYEIIRGERCRVRMAIFGECVLYLPLKTANSLKEQAQPRMKQGIWLGVLERTEEAIIGTAQGIVKCRIVNRLREDQRWNKTLLKNMKGTPWSPVPKVKGDHIPVEIKEDGNPTTIEEETVEKEAEVNFEEEPKSKSTPSTSGYKEAGVTEFHIKKPMVQKYGYIDGCPACQRLKGLGKDGQTPTGRLGTNHSVACKTRIMHRMKDDPIDRHIVEAYQRRSQRSHLGSMQQKELEEMVLKMTTTTTMDVAEIYSPERVTRLAKEYGFSAGWAMDLTTTDENGRPWDFDCAHMRTKATRRLLEDKPTLLMCSPMCTDFCTLTHINHKRMAKEVIQERMRTARTPLRFCTKLYALQLHHGRHSLHEHPLGATSWQEECIKELLGKNGVTKVSADQCQYGLVSRDANGEGKVRKAIGFLTNAPYIAMQLSKRCPNRLGEMKHRHVVLEGGRTKAAQVYPEGSCRATCKGLMEQLESDRKGQFILAQLEGTETEMQDVQQQLAKEYPMVEENDTTTMEQAWDDVTGAELDAGMVKSARQDEISYIRKMGLYKNVPASNCWKDTGKGPIKVRWIDINKGDVKQPNYRSRLVAKEINTYKQMDLFAATPLLEALKLILSTAATQNRGEVVMVNDASMAFPHATVKRNVYVELPDEDKGKGDERRCAKLEYSMYGTRDAAINWHDEYSQQLVANGFAQGRATPCVFLPSTTAYPNCSARGRLRVGGKGGGFDRDGRTPQKQV